jgi:hypothetical protein
MISIPVDFIELLHIKLIVYLAAVAIVVGLANERILLVDNLFGLTVRFNVPDASIKPFRYIPSPIVSSCPAEGGAHKVLTIIMMNWVEVRLIVEVMLIDEIVLLFKL